MGAGEVCRIVGEIVSTLCEYTEKIMYFFVCSRNVHICLGRCNFVCLSAVEMYRCMSAGEMYRCLSAV